MDGKDLLPVEIAEALERGATVVTGNQRAARTLRRDFDRRNRGLGLNSWRPPAVLSWDAWTAGLWHRLLIDGYATQLLLNRMQEHAVWREILIADPELASLKSKDALAEMAAEAWRLLCRYDGRGRLRRAAVSADTKAFQRWAQVFERRCRFGGFLAHAQLEETLVVAVQAGQLEIGTGGIALVGFDILTPAQMGLVEALRAAGEGVTEVRLATPIEHRMLVGATDEVEELSVAARWVREYLERQPGARVAVIVPGLETQRSEIDRVFREVLSPELEDIALPDAGPYEFSLGRTLTEYPMVAVALELLRWAATALPIERVSGLLLSPYFSSAMEEQGERAEFDAFELRRARMLRPEVSLDGLIVAMEGSRRRAGLGQLLDALRAMRRVAVKRLNDAGQLTHAEWAERMRELLEAAGWSVSRHEDSIEFQTRRRWERVLDELATLDFDGQRIRFENALEDLERIAQKTVFAPESREAPVQVMGPLEAAGGSFDAVWFLRAGDLSWPVATGGSPLLSWQMQRELGVSGTDVARDREAARRVTERIAVSTGTVVFSYASESAEGRQRASSVLTGPGLELEKVEVAQLMVAVERVMVAVEEIEDAERVQALPDRVIRGGARILELQAACGFRAFAERRLWSTEVESTELGMDARESGTVVHRVLEYLWDEVRTQSALGAMTSTARAEMLDGCIVRALHRTAELSATVWDEAYVAMQRERLRRLLEPWLELELKRKLPFTVKMSEKEFRDVPVGPLRLSVRMDRVDVVEGGEVLIDYKTGLASPKDWLTERPNAPQLPLYAILSDPKQLQGVAFGLVRAGDGMGLRGYAVQEGVLPSKPTKLKVESLEAQVEEWRRVLARLAEDFASGNARVAPNHYPTTCERCAQRLLCRLDVSLLEEGDDEDRFGTEESLG
jgi:ATP-dependent helicase/nuclease subunit B